MNLRDKIKTHRGQEGGRGWVLPGPNEARSQGGRRLGCRRVFWVSDVAFYGLNQMRAPQISPTRKKMP